MKICLDCVQDLFKHRDYLYFVTIKPPPDRVELIYQLTDYLRKHHMTYWIVLCQSKKGYIHYHGVISYNETQTPNKGMHGNFQRKVNRTMGFLCQSPLSGGLPVAYSYIRGEKNEGVVGTDFAQDDYYTPMVFPHKCLF